MQTPIDPSAPPPVSTPAADASPSRTRRRLLLGATGALPSVLTLSSGAQAAVASNLRCLTPPPQMPTRFTPQDDNWVRAQVNVGAFENRPAYCISTPGNACVDSTMHAAPGSKWVVNGNTMTVGIQNSNFQVLNERSYGLVYIDSTGSIQTLDSQSSVNLQPVTDSCWTSLLGGRTSNLG